nr:site-specific integrase [Fredinandcohnia onubensis]
MGVIKEMIHPLGTIYARFNDEGEVIQKAGVIGFSKQYKDYYYFILTDINGHRIKEANRFLNVELKDASFKSREMAFSALKAFYSFVYVFKFNNYKQGITQKKDLKMLIRFLEGGFYKGTVWDLDIKTIRSNNTINFYLSVYRNFYETIFGLKNTLINDKFVVSKYSGGGMMGHANKKAVESYKANKGIKEDKSPPKYIKEKEYEAIIQLIENQYSTRDLVIIKLMYKYGLRIGEVLGITLEDIRKTISGNYIIEIRDRFTDRPDQRGKGVMKIKSRQDYQKKNYKKKGIGYQQVVIDQDMFNLINEYIDESRDEFMLNSSLKKKQNLEKYAKADSVLNREDIQVNYYLFLSHQHYKPLTQGGWNYVCRGVFHKIGIPVDLNVKEENLSHRFRHGFAMKKAKEGYSYEELADSLRHSGIHSVLKYYNPDEDDKAELLQGQRKYMKDKGVTFDEKPVDAKDT